jgi:AcrR family transcriptional regulator
MTRRSKEQRRTDYLDIGAEIVAESTMAGGYDPGLALAHVKLADVADRAGVTKGALYHIWPSQEAFWHDLLMHLIDSNQLFAADQLAEVGVRLAEQTGGLPTLREYGNALFDALSVDPAFYARISLFSYLDDARVRDELDRTFRSSIEWLLPALEQGVPALGRQLIDGATMWDLAVAISALLEGLCLQYRISSSRTPEVPLVDDDRWTLFAAAADALLAGYTVPLHDDPAVA